MNSEKEKKIAQIEFKSFIKLFASILFSLGIAAGVLALMIGLLGGHVYVNIGSIHLTGLPAGLVGIFLFPIICYIVGLFWGLIAFIPFKFFLKLTGGLKIKGEFI